MGQHRRTPPLPPPPPPIVSPFCGSWWVWGSPPAMVHGLWFMGFRVRLQGSGFSLWSIGSLLV